MTKIIKLNLTPEQSKNWTKKIEEAKERSMKRTEEVLKKIPKIHFEILEYANKHTKEECIFAYPEHEDFINKIIFNKDKKTYSFAKIN